MYLKFYHPSLTILNHHEPSLTMGNPYETAEDRDVRGRVGAVGHRRRHLAGHRGGGRWKRPTLESGAGKKWWINMVDFMVVQIYEK